MLMDAAGDPLQRYSGFTLEYYFRLRPPYCYGGVGRCAFSGRMRVKHGRVGRQLVKGFSRPETENRSEKQIVEAEVVNRCG